MSAVRLDHLGIIVTDLEKAVDRFRVLIGGGPAATKEMPEIGLRIATFEAENIAIELIEFAGPEADFAKQVMGESPGLNHLSIEVEDMARAINELTAAGFELTDGFPRAGAHGQVAFFRPDEATGLLFEICERAGSQ